jgi:hypothetical protein
MAIGDTVPYRKGVAAVGEPASRTGVELLNVDSRCGPSVRFAGRGERGDEMIVDNRQQLLLPPTKPSLSCTSLAFWAMAVTTTVERDGLVTATIELVPMPA